MNRTPRASATSLSPRLAGFLLLLCLGASYAVPYHAAGLKEAYESREWAKTGLSGAEIDAWKREKIGRRMAVRWRNAGFQPPHASIWRSEGFAPENAGMWNGSGFSPHEAVSWGKAGFSPQEATQWKGSGFYYSVAGEWKKKGVSPQEAAVRRERGEWP